jgi:hypothetical protein
MSDAEKSKAQAPARPGAAAVPKTELDRRADAAWARAESRWSSTNRVPDEP